MKLGTFSVACGFATVAGLAIAYGMRMSKRIDQNTQCGSSGPLPDRARRFGSAD